jgi:hypothetical protein
MVFERPDFRRSRNKEEQRIVTESIINHRKIAFLGRILAPQRKPLIGTSEQSGDEMKLISRRRWWMAIAAAVLTLGTALAHHSTAEFDYTKEVTIKGHRQGGAVDQSPLLHPIARDGQPGEKIQWSVEIGSPTLNINLGWRKDSVKFGDEVTMNLAPARNGKPYGTLRVLTFADGKQLKGVAAQVRGQPPRPARARSRKEAASMQQRSSRNWTALILPGLLICIAGMAACIRERLSVRQRLVRFPERDLGSERSAPATRGLWTDRCLH